jgi:hypothetical protein
VENKATRSLSAERKREIKIQKEKALIMEVVETIREEI